MAHPVLIIGATSDIGWALAAEFARHGHALALAARRTDQLQTEAEDLRLRHGVAVTVHHLDLLEDAAIAPFVAALEPLPGIAVCVVGLLGDQAESERDLAAADRVMRSNYNGPAAVLAALANRFQARGSGILVGISSVAGDRGRATNYVYGSAKAGFTAFLSGLRNRLAQAGVHVLTVKPGFVDTRMTAGMTLPPALTAQPEEVAAAIYKACKRRRDVLYVRPAWRLVMTVIGAIPERVFKRLRL
ncbi:MAG: SDR family oxidoreductase [Alphaproteobacteria bacterium]|nr:SDR family oxidoreductase [Alphaproteobacteria bacterium]